MATPEQIKTALDGMKSSIDLIAGLKKQRGFFNCLKAVVSIIGPVIRRVEDLANGLGIRGADKRSLAVDIIMFLLTPLMSAWTPWVRALVATVVPYVVDAAVGAVNYVVGRVWPKNSA